MKNTSTSNHAMRIFIEIVAFVAVFAASIPANAEATFQALWSQYAPLCKPTIDGQEIPGYPSKAAQGLEWDCDDGDMTLFNGLLCASGDPHGCDAVKRSQSPDGRFWRSPGRALTNNWLRGDSPPSSFSPDMGIGVQLYVAKTKDTSALQRWLNWLEENRPCTLCQPFNSGCTASNGCMIKGPTRFCFSSDCTLRPGDSVQLKETANSFGLHYGEGLDLIGDVMSVSDWILTNANLNESGFSRHLVSAQLLLMRMLGSGDAAKLNEAASILSSKEPMNPFFAYLDKGATKEVQDLTKRLCPATSSDIANMSDPKFHQWAWERTDSEMAWKHSMLWDCIFMANLAGISGTSTERLSVTKSGAGSGTVTSNPTGIDCGSTNCSADFTSGTNVTLTATPTAGSGFSGWGGACTGTGSCAVSMTASQSVAATFDNACTYTLNANSASVGAASSTGNIFNVGASSSTCAWTATSNASWITITANTPLSGNGTVSYAVTANTGTTARTGTITITGLDGAIATTFTVTQSGPMLPPLACTLSANPTNITSDGSATLTAACNPAATSYIWTGGTCVGTSGASCTVSPTATTTYTVTGVNAGGTAQAAIATVTVAANTTHYTLPGTLGNDVFVLTAGNSYYGGAGNDTYIISPNTLSGDVTAEIIDTEGDNLIQLVDGMTVTASSFYPNAAQLTLSTGAKVQILGASKFKYQVGANALAGDSATVLNYTDFVASLGGSLSGTLPAAGTAGFVVPTGFTQAVAPVPTVSGIASTVPGTLADDVLVPSGGNNSYLGGGGNDTYIISPYTLSGAITAKIIDTEGSNVIQFVKGMTIASSSFFNNAAQLMLTNGAIVQILGASGFRYQLGANATAGETAASLNYAQFVATLGASVPAADAAAVSGQSNFQVSHITVSEVDNGRSLELETGQILSVQLSANASTGYGWQFNDLSTSVVTREGSPSYVAYYPMMSGSGGVETWKFRATNIGSGTVHLEYLRSWEVGIAPIRVVEFFLTVK